MITIHCLKELRIFSNKFVMKEEELDREILSLFYEIDKKLSEKQKLLIHFRSISNFVHHLVNNPCYHKKGNKKLQKLGEMRMKQKLLEYLKLTKDFRKDYIKFPLNYYDNYISPIGRFMNEYYDFFTVGGKAKFIIALPVIFFGLVLDILMYLFFSFTIPTFVLSLLLIYIIRTFIKHKQRRVYGPNY